MERSRHLPALNDAEPETLSKLPAMTDWRQWMGGDRPVPADTIVDVRFRYAGQATRRAADIRWSHDLYNAYGADDVVAFRLREGPERD